MTDLSITRPAFHGKMELTRFADDAINAKISKLTGKTREKVLEQYDSLIRSVINSNLDVFVSETAKGKLSATVKPHNGTEILSSVNESKSLFQKFQNPIKFIHTAFAEAKQKVQGLSTQEAVQFVASKKL